MPGPSDRLPVRLVVVVVPVHEDDAGCALTSAGPYDASKPAPSKLESEVKITVSWPLSAVSVAVCCISPVRTLASGDDDDNPRYTLTKSKFASSEMAEKVS